MAKEKPEANKVVDAKTDVAAKTEVKTKNRKKPDARTMVLGAVFTALVIVLQLLGQFIRFGPFSISLVLIPIVLGAATCGIGVGTWLGFVFGVAVLISGDANLFMGINPAGAVITVLLKGIACGFAAGVVFKAIESWLKKRNEKRIQRLVEKELLCLDCQTTMTKYFSRNSQYVATIAAAIVCPVVNTGVFLLGCGAFFMDTISEWAGDMNTITYMIVGLVGFNFLFELGTNILLSPIVTRILSFRKHNK